MWTKYTNCYAYALDIVVDPNTNERFKKQDASDKWGAGNVDSGIEDPQVKNCDSIQTVILS